MATAGDNRKKSSSKEPSRRSSNKTSDPEEEINPAEKYVRPELTRPGEKTPPPRPAPNLTQPSTSTSELEKQINDLQGLVYDLLKDRKDSNNNGPPKHAISPRSDSDMDRHLSSEEDGQYTEDETDPLDNLANIIKPDSKSTNASQDVDKKEFEKVMAEFSNYFKVDEEKAEPIKEEVAKTLNLSLRKRPIEANIKETAAKIKFPSNIPNLIVPETNKDLVSAMKFPARLMDLSQKKIAGLIARAMTPIATIVSDIGEQKTKKTEDYLEGLVDSLRLLAAAFNYTNQSRKDIIRNNVNDKSLAELCKWDVEVGTQELFPFDCTKKIEEMRKSKKIGYKPSYHKSVRTSSSYEHFGTSRPDNTRYHPYYKGRKPSRGYYSPRYDQRYGSTEDRSKKPFFQGRKKHDKRK